ncbi:MAG TPA: zinc-dependent alcohol dehydrogenase [Amycolatopsis sp.]|uniref:zinc-dependent alcohol dehydrogenase n=1 Tax=Amycolatopsis sp. TaxID=37632 RepID=UPI002B466616|nr:zinc-dependent alcohol dehydrogenase [Amycolatopsis sp.]HKS49849.1 zinc-dependent alcohol dehydrogenase [Amycolatopsis sp.]
MKAAVVPELGAKPEIQDLPVPEPGPGQVLVRMVASGICHTDIHAAHGDWPVKPNPPFVPGHEGVGIVEKLGPGAGLHAVGDRVAIAWLGSACGNCSYCVSGWETLCESQQNSGYSIDGAYAEYAVADDRFVVAVPGEVSSLDAAPLTCAGVTTFKSIKVSRLQPGETAVVFGIGGLGHLALQYARIFGARVIAVDLEDEKLELATSLGADHVINARDTDPVEAIQDLGGADVAVALASAPKPFEQAFSSLRRGGRLVCVALPASGTMSVPIFDTVLGGKSIIGSIVGTRADLADVFKLHAAGRTKIIAESRRLEDVNACFDDVLAGRVPARLVFEF